MALSQCRDIPLPDLPAERKTRKMTDLILSNARIVLQDEVIHGSLRIAEGVIAEVQPGPSRLGEDMGGDLLLPGLVELHTDNLERHIQPRPKVAWPHAAAIIAHDGELASTGITTVFDALRVGSIISDAKTNYGEYARTLADEILDLRAKGALRISHFLHLRAEVCSETLCEELTKFRPEDGVGIVSLMDHTPGQRQFRDVSQLKTYYRGKYGVSDDVFEAEMAKQRKLGLALGPQHEKAAVEASRRLGAVLASHDDTEPHHVAQSAGHGARFAEFPTTIEAAQSCREHGILVMMGAPNLVRGGSHSGNVAARELAEADLLDIVSSDYIPSSLLAGGLMLADLWDDVPRGVATVTAAPARAAGLSDRGALAPGLRADLIRVGRFGASASLKGVWVAGHRVG